MTAMDAERFRQLRDDEDQARWLAEHPNPSPLEWPLILLLAAGTVLILVGLCYAAAGFIVGSGS